MNNWSTENFYGGENTFCDPIMMVHVIIYFSKPMESTSPKVNSEVHFGVTMMFIVSSSIPTNVLP